MLKVNPTFPLITLIQTKYRPKTVLLRKLYKRFVFLQKLLIEPADTESQNKITKNTFCQEGLLSKTVLTVRAFLRSHYGHRVLLNMLNWSFGSRVKKLQLPSV